MCGCCRWRRMRRRSAIRRSATAPNDMHLAVTHSLRTGQTVPSAVLDNLGRGAAGAAVRNPRLIAGAGRPAD